MYNMNEKKNIERNTENHITHFPQRDYCRKAMTVICLLAGNVED